MCGQALSILVKDLRAGQGPEDLTICESHVVPAQQDRVLLADQDVMDVDCPFLD